MKKTIYLSLVLFSLFSITSCKEETTKEELTNQPALDNTIETNTIKLIPELKGVTGVNLARVDLDEVYITFNLDFYNPGPLFANKIIGPQVTPQDLKVYVGNNELASVQTDPFKVYPFSNFTIPSTIRFAPGRILTSIPGFLISILRGTADLRVKGKIEIKKGLLSFIKFYINIDQVIPL